MSHILVVEDDPVNQRMLAFTLKKHGHTVVKAQHGRDALERMAEQAIDLVITDIGMPVMDGLTLLKHLRADERYHALPVVVITADIEEQTSLEAHAEGINGFLNKPTSSWELLETINHCLGEK
jgi:CheY-like chemotaxis protein